MKTAPAVRIGKWPAFSPCMIDAPFDTIESAHDFVELLKKQVLMVELEIVEDIGEATREGAARRLDALRLVHYKLARLTGSPRCRQPASQ